MPELCPHSPVHWNQSAGKGSGRFECGPCSPCEPLDPTSPKVWAVLEAVVQELAGLFPDAVFHQGADEVLDPAEGFVHELCWQVWTDKHMMPLPSLPFAMSVAVVQVLDPAGHFSHTLCWQSSPRIAAWLKANFPHANENHGDNAYMCV